MPATRHSLLTNYYSLLTSFSHFLESDRIAKIGVVEQLFQLAQLADHALPMDIALDRFKVLAVGIGETVLPWIGPKNLPLLLDCGAHPGERHHARVRYPLIGHLLRRLECLDQVGGDPGIFVDDLLANRGDVHDREYPGLAIILDLDLLVVRKQPRNALIAHHERTRDGGGDHRWNVAVSEHVVERLGALLDLDAQIARRVEGDVLAAVGHPCDRAVRYAIALFQNAAHPDVAGRHEIGAADLFSDQVLRRLDA